MTATEIEGYIWCRWVENTGSAGARENTARQISDVARRLSGITRHVSGVARRDRNITRQVSGVTKRDREATRRDRTHPVIRGEISHSALPPVGSWYSAATGVSVPIHSRTVVSDGTAR